VNGEVTKLSLKLDVDGFAPEGCRCLAADVFWSPTAMGDDPILLFCFPGGGISRRYFDLAVPGYSMARHLAAQGFLTVTVDHPGVGESDVPTDPWTLTPEMVADVDVAAVTRMLEVLAAGEVEGLPAFTPSLVIGLGHSAGGLVVLHQQSRRSPYAAIAVLGWAGHGLPEFLDETGLRLADHPERLSADLVNATRLRYPDPLVDMPRGSMDFLVANPPPEEVHLALADARTPLLAIVGYASLIPGSASLCVSAITVPVFLAVGDRDIARQPHQLPANFTSSGDLTVFVIPNAGHNHNIEPTRALLWDRVAAWALSMKPHSTCAVATDTAL
jgi:pimeloyl-ACP methyl ester carboxylesterase